MKKPTLISFLLLYFFIGYSQQNILVFKKKYKTLTNFWVGSSIAFQTKDRKWQKGDITKIQNDSFYIRPKVIQHSLYRTDTFYYNVLGFSILDVYAMPKNGVLVDYKNGEYQIVNSGGHQHWYWLKNGSIFRIVGAAYAALVVVNGLINSDLSENTAQLAIAAGVFLVGVVMQKIYKQTLRLGKKYRLTILQP